MNDFSFREKPELGQPWAGFRTIYSQTASLEQTAQNYRATLVTEGDTAAMKMVLATPLAAPLVAPPVAPPVAPVASPQVSKWLLVRSASVPRAGLRNLGDYTKSTDLRVLCLQRIRARIFGSLSHGDLHFGENQLWRFALSTCSFEVEKEK